MQGVDALEYEWLSKNDKFKVINVVVHDYCWKILDIADHKKFYFSKNYQYKIIEFKS
jgi:hypothetical protein